MTTYLTTRWRNTVSDPNAQDLAAALEELDKPDDEHPDCWLSSENGWTITVFQSGKIIFENVETGEGPWYLIGISRALTLELWQLLQTNNLTALQSKPWVDGYGNT